MTKRERRYHELKDLFKPCTIPLYGYINNSPIHTLLTTADLKQIVKEIKEGFDSETAKKFLHDEPKMWDSYEEVKAREELRRNAWFNSLGRFPIQPPQ